MSRFNQSQIPSNAKLVVKHLHEGNSSRSTRHGRKYVTIATVKDVESGRVLSRGTAHCSNKDNPSRKLGRTIAIGRAIKNLRPLF